MVYIFIKKEFWRSVSYYRTHPIVTFNNDFIMYALQEDETYFYSPIDTLNEFYDKVLVVPLIKVKNSTCI